jgi:GT2 family glycosyltransferase
VTAAVATVIIVNYNGAHLLPACLRGLRGQAAGAPAFDTVVVDNASADGSLALLRRDFPWVRVIANAANLGFAGGNNVALRQLRTPFAVLLNNDAVPEPDWLAALLAAFTEPGSTDVGIVTGKIVFLPRFASVRIASPGFVPAGADSRELGVRVLGVHADGEEVTGKVLWGTAAYGPEESPGGSFRWTRPAGELLVPLPPATGAGGRLAAPVTLGVTVLADRPTPFTLAAGEQRSVTEAGPDPVVAQLELPAGTAVLDVINNVGGQVFSDGSGGDRGFQQVDRGQFEEPSEVFTACGNGMAMRASIGRELGWFDDAFFMYYEDTDLSWRWRAAGWTIRYQPSAVLRHIHAASSKEWSPFWRFHVDRNRLLMLTKNGTADLAAGAVAGYLRATAGELTRAGRRLTRGRRPGLAESRLRARVLGSYLAHAPRALRDRRRRRRSAVVPARELQRWLVPQ